MPGIVSSHSSASFRVIIFDTSAINALRNDPEVHTLLAEIARAYYTRLTEYNVHEIAATRFNSDKKELLDVCQELLRNGECVHRPQSIISALIKDYEAHGSSYWNGNIRVPEYERLIVDRVAFDTGADEQRLAGESTEQEFRAVFGELRPEFEQLFDEGTERPQGFGEWLSLLKPPGGAFWDYAARLYRLEAGYLPDEAKMRKFVAVCPPVDAVVHCLSLAQFERSVRDLRSAPSYRSGHVDLFSAAYLPYCDIFVTHDQIQERCLRDVGAAAGLATKIRSYRDFRGGMLPDR